MFENPELYRKFGRRYEPRKLIFCEHEMGDELFFILSGKVKVSKITKEREKIIAYLGAGEFFGEMAIFENKPRAATVISEEITEVLAFKKDEFYKLMTLAPNLVVELIKTLSIRYLNTEKQLNNLLTENIQRRIFQYIRDEYLKDKGKSEIFEIDILEMAEILSVEREKVLEIFGKYQKMGVSQIIEEKIFIPDFRRFESVAKGL